MVVLWELFLQGLNVTRGLISPFLPKGWLLPFRQ
jgi:hypothetical protein